MKTWRGSTNTRTRPGSSEGWVGVVKLLLTSGGVTNGSIRAAMVEPLGKPFADADALFIPTAQWGHPHCTPHTVWKSTAGRREGLTGLVDLGWKSDQGDATLSMVDFSIFPHLDYPGWDGNTTERSRQWARERVGDEAGSRSE